MRLLLVTVKNFRMHEDLTVEFDRIRTLVAGPNESGKSTLLEAIKRVLFHPHRSKTGLEEIKPKAGGGPPEVTLRFERCGRTFTIRKVFKKAQATAELIDETTGERFSGDEAEAQLRSLLALRGGTLSQAVYGWSHLWALQGEATDNPTGKDSLTPAEANRLNARLQSLTGTTLTESNVDSVTYQRITDEYKDSYTSKGVKAGSPLAAAAAELIAAQAAAATAANDLAELETAADTVIREEDAIRSLRQTSAIAQQHLATTLASLTTIEQLEETLRREKGELETAEEAYQQLHKGDREIADVSESLKALRQGFASQNEEIANLRSHEQRMQNEVTSAPNVTSRAFAAREAAATTRDLLSTLARLFDLETQRVDLETKQAAIERVSHKLTAIEKSLRELPEVDRSTISELEDLDRQRQMGIAKLEAIATRLEVTCADVAVLIEGEQLTDGTSRTLADAADLRIGEGTTIRIIPGGGQSLAALRVEIADLESRLSRRLKELGVASISAAREDHESRLAADVESSRLQEKILDLGGKHVATRLTAVKADIEKVEAEITRKTPAGFVRPTDTTALEAAIQTAEEGQRQAERSVEQANAAYDAAVAAANAARVNRETAEQKAVEQATAVRNLEIKKAALERAYGISREVELRRLAGLVQVAADAQQKTTRAIAALSPDLTRSDKQRFEMARDQHERQIKDAELRLAGAKAIVGKTGSVDLHGVKAAADARLAIATRRHAEVLRRAEAVRRLRDLFDTRRQHVAELVATPLRMKVAEYLEALYGPGCRFSITKTGDGFTDLQVARPSLGGLDFEFENLSGGTREQVAAACRLAMAELLAGEAIEGGSGGDACLPVVFDDAFVNSDPDRLTAVHRVLELGARRGLQIIVLSCDPHEYAFFPAKRVDMPQPAWGSSLNEGDARPVA